MSLSSMFSAVRALQSTASKRSAGGSIDCNAAPVVVRKSGGQDTSVKITRVIRPATPPEPVSVRKGDVIDISDHQPQPVKADPHSTKFVEVLAAKMREQPAFDLSPLMNNTQTTKAEVVKLTKSAEPVEVKKAKRGVDEGLMRGGMHADKAVADITADLIAHAVNEAAGEILAKVNRALEGRSTLAKAEPETPSQRIEREQAEWRNELAEIDAQIMLGTSGLIDLYMPEPGGVTKAEAKGDAERWRRSMGLQETVRKEAYPGAR